MGNLLQDPRLDFFLRKLRLGEDSEQLGNRIDVGQHDQVVEVDLLPEVADFLSVVWITLRVLRNHFHVSRIERCGQTVTNLHGTARCQVREVLLVFWSHGGFFVLEGNITSLDD